MLSSAAGAREHFPSGAQDSIGGRNLSLPPSLISGGHGEIHLVWIEDEAAMMRQRIWRGVCVTCLPLIIPAIGSPGRNGVCYPCGLAGVTMIPNGDRKSTRLN